MLSIKYLKYLLKYLLNPEYVLNDQYCYSICTAQCGIRHLLFAYFRYNRSCSFFLDGPIWCFLKSKLLYNSNLIYWNLKTKLLTKIKCIWSDMYNSIVKGNKNAKLVWLCESELFIYFNDLFIINWWTGGFPWDAFFFVSENEHNKTAPNENIPNIPPIENTIKKPK